MDRVLTAVGNYQSRHEANDVIVLRPAHNSGFRFIAADTEPETNCRAPCYRIDGNGMDMRGVFVTPRQVESADLTPFELGHIVPGRERLNGIADFLGLGNLLVSN